MLQKSKSKQVKLLKYALLIPVILGMLVYTSCEKESEINETDALDLSQYSYTLKKGEKLVGEKKEIHEKYEAFLKANPDYVSWTDIDSESNRVSYSVHSMDDKIPEQFSKSTVDFPDGSSYTTFINWEKTTSPETEEIMGKRIDVMYKIDNHGKIIEVRSIAPHPALEAEAKRVRKTLLKYKSGINNGKTVNVPYSLPIVFQVSE